MNFLAHIFLSGKENELLSIGNFMGDSIRGKEYLSYPEIVQQGILLHRKIDFFTDTHPVFRLSRKRLVPDYKHYSGVITDIFYDYFLAKNWSKYSEIPLENYAQEFYFLLQKQEQLLNETTKKIAKYMTQENWLVSYKTIQGIEKILFQMDRRTQFQSKMQYAVHQLVENESLFENEFFEFFAQIQEFVANQI